MREKVGVVFLCAWIACLQPAQAGGVFVQTGADVLERRVPVTA